MLWAYFARPRQSANAVAAFRREIAALPPPEVEGSITRRVDATREIVANQGFWLARRQHQADAAAAAAASLAAASSGDAPPPPDGGPTSHHTTHVPRGETALLSKLRGKLLAELRAFDAWADELGETAPGAGSVLCAASISVRDGNRPKPATRHEIARRPTPRVARSRAEPMRVCSRAEPIHERAASRLHRGPPSLRATRCLL